ncbi:sphingoid long-chain bases kinase 1-like [Triticum urartu]|uniref:sphingoid long-chain bases kinase 1-like n=1 Tax=Triticum dicoccoides TaxID=85692 RepID=UPI000E7AB9B2|nr:sphingoid long-chain bases kinase 1-like [Triticum dicoccoides]XP_048530803.1 sphingoid long-chain bases kinase 1-like [Triticum urartu]
MQKSDHHEQNLTSPRGLIHKVLRRTSSRRSPTAAEQDPSPVFPETSNTKFLKQKNVEGASKDPEKGSTHDNRIEDEKSDLLGYEVCSGKLTLDNKDRSVSGEQSGSGSSGNCFDARLTTEALVWGSNILKLEDIVSVSYNSGLRHFTVHACPLERRSNGLSCFMKPRRIQKDLRFLSTAPHEAFRWVNGFADQQCYVNLLPHPMASSKKHSSELIPFDAMLDPYVKCRSPPKILVILNPRSGHGRSSKVFHGKVEPIFKLAGFKMEVIKTTHAGHAKSLVSTIDFSTCPDGIVCVGGDGIVNEVLNGLLCRDDQIEAGSLPIGIIPAGSDNSLVWTVLGVKDPISAALSIVRGGFTPIDVFSVEWIQSGTTHFGTTVSYFGFVSDVLELSEKYQKRFGPLRYIVAGFLKFLCLPKYSFELEYLPVADVDGAGHKIVEGQEKVDTSDLYDDVVQRSRAECLPRASSLSSIDSIMSTSIMSGGEPEVSSPRANNEPSELVRALDPKSKRQSLGRTSTFKEPEESLHPQASTPSWRRSKSKSRTEKAWPGLTATNDTKPSKGTTTHDKEDTSSTISDPGPAWDTGPKWDMEPKWDNQPNWEPETPIELHGPSDDIELGLTKELVPSLDERWVIRKGRYLGVLVCNHSCKTVQSLSSQIVAPKAEYDDNCLDLLLVGGSGRLRLLRFLVLLQFGKHISLPNVEYVKVRSVRLKAGPNTHDGCGIDGELLHVKGQVRCSLLPQQSRLIGRPAKNPVQ